MSSRTRAKKSLRLKDKILSCRLKVNRAFFLVCRSSTDALSRQSEKKWTTTRWFVVQQRLAFERNAAKDHFVFCKMFNCAIWSHKHTSTTTANEPMFVLNFNAQSFHHIFTQPEANSIEVGACSRCLHMHLINSKAHVNYYYFPHFILF